ncbi:MAG: 23S rRNA (pseudouridine(1915)-N(3))-methyltransferase RlmH [Burkholderiaceae bacterium]
MKITIVAVGLRQPDWAETAVTDYLARFPSDFRVELKTVKAETRSGQPAAKLMAAEAERIRAAIPSGSLIVAMDERGRDLTSAQFAHELGRWRDNAESPVFVIGGADGLDPPLKSSARMLMRLSAMTLPHALARVLLAEQIYRGWSLLANHPYHRA